MSPHTTQDEADKQHTAALDEILCLWDNDEDGPQPASHREQASLLLSKSGCGIPMIAEIAPGACLASLSHALPLLLRHTQGQSIQGLHDHALAMISHPDDKPRASSAHAKVKTTHDWLVDPTNKVALANINVTFPPIRIPQSAIDTITQQPNLRESDYAKLALLLALLLSPTSGTVSHGDRSRILSALHRILHS